LVAGSLRGEAVDLLNLRVLHDRESAEHRARDERTTHPRPDESPGRRGTLEAVSKAVCEHDEPQPERDEPGLFTNIVNLVMYLAQF
jgi:hypothetical protein